MAPLPKKRHSRERKGKRRAAISLSLPTLVACSNCKSLKLPHNVCPSCGFYRSRVEINTQPKVKVTKVST